MTEFDQLFKALQINEDNLKEEILDVGVLQNVSKNSYIIEQDKYIKWLALAISGKVRVWQENEDRAIPIEVQRSMYKGKVKKVFTLHSSLTPNFSQPEKLANILLEL